MRKPHNQATNSPGTHFPYKNQRMRPLSHTRRLSTGHSKNKVWKSKRKAQRKFDSVRLATVFMPKPKELRTYDEMVDDLKTY